MKDTRNMMSLCLSIYLSDISALLCLDYHTYLAQKTDS